MTKLLSVMLVAGIALATLPMTSMAQTYPGQQVLAEQFEGYSDQERRMIQSALSQSGLYGGAIDGQFGPGTRGALETLALMLTEQDANRRFDLWQSQDASLLLRIILSGEALPAVAQPSDGLRRFYQYGQVADCNSYAEATLQDNRWFSGGEGGSVQLDNARLVPGLNATSYDAVVTEEGVFEPIGTMMFIETSLFDQSTGVSRPVMIVVEQSSSRIYEQCR